MTERRLQIQPSRRLIRVLSKLSTGFGVLALMAITNPALAHAKSSLCSNLFEAPFVTRGGSRVGSLTAASIPMFYAPTPQGSLFDEGYSGKNSLTDPEPWRDFVEKEITRIEPNLSLAERILIFEKLIQQPTGIFGKFGRSFMAMSLRSSGFYEMNDHYLSPTDTYYLHPRVGRIKESGGGEVGITRLAETVKVQKQFATEHLASKNSKGFRAARVALLNSYVNFGRRAFPIWKLALESNDSQAKYLPLEFVMDNSPSGAGVLVGGSLAVEIVKGVIEVPHFSETEKTQAREFMRWIDEKSERQEYAQLLLTLAFNRLSQVIAGPNEGRLLNNGEVMKSGFYSLGKIDKVARKIKAIGSDKAAKLALDGAPSEIRRDGRAEPVDSNESLIYDTELAFHFAPHATVVRLLFDFQHPTFTEHMQSYLRAATMFVQSVEQQKSRLHSLQAQTAIALESGKISPDLENKLYLSLSDLSKTLVLEKKITSALQILEAHAQKEKRELKLSSPETSAIYAERAETLRAFNENFRSVAQTQLPLLMEDADLLELVVDEAERLSPDQQMEMSRLARTLWRSPGSR